MHCDGFFSTRLMDATEAWISTLSLYVLGKLPRM